MKTLKTLLTLLIVVFSLSACTDAKIKYEIDQKNTVSLHYTANIDLTNLDVETRNGLVDLCKKMEEEYKTIGFVSKSEFSKSFIVMDMRLDKKTSNLDEAYSTLKDLMINPDISFLLSTDISTITETYQSAYQIELETNLPAILHSTGMNDLPPTIKNPLIEKLNLSNVTLELVLPLSTIVSMSDDITHLDVENKTILSQKIKTDDSTVFNVIGKISLENGKIIPIDMESNIQNTDDKLNLSKNLIYVGLVLSILSILGLVYNIYKTKQSM